MVLNLSQFHHTRHTSHRLQPLDVSFSKPLKINYAENVRLWLMQIPDKPSRVAGIFSKAYLSNCRMELTVSGFAATGVFPFNRNIFTPEDFIADNENSQRNELIENIHEATGVSDVGETSSSAKTPTQPLQTSVENLINDLSLKRNINCLKKRSTSRQQSSMILHASPVKTILEKKSKKTKGKKMCWPQGVCEK